MHRITLAGYIPVAVSGEHSQPLCGDASPHSVIDTPTRTLA